MVYFIQKTTTNRDLDPGTDDLLALLLALSSPSLLIRTITLTHGNAPLAQCLINLRKFFWALERQQLEEREGGKERWWGTDGEWRKGNGVGKIEVVRGYEGEAVTDPEGGFFGS